MLHVATVDALQACGMNVRRFSLLHGMVWVYGPVGTADLHVTGREEADKPLIGVYTEHSPLKWIVDDLIDHFTRHGTKLLGVA